MVGGNSPQNRFYCLVSDSNFEGFFFSRMRSGHEILLFERHGFRMVQFFEPPNWGSPADDSRIFLSVLQLQLEISSRDLMEKDGHQQAAVDFIKSKWGLVTSHWGYHGTFKDVLFSSLE